MLFRLFVIALIDVMSWKVRSAVLFRARHVAASCHLLICSEFKHILPQCQLDVETVFEVKAKVAFYYKIDEQKSNQASFILGGTIAVCVVAWHTPS